MIKRILLPRRRGVRLCLLFAISCLPALAQSNAVSSFAFGPQRIVLGFGQPEVQTATFTVPARVDGPFTLIVQDEIGATREATISLNGVQLFGPHDFENKRTFQVPVTLNTGGDQTNTLAVSLPRKEPGEIWISIVGYSYKFASDYASIPQWTGSGSDDIDWRVKGVVTPVKNEGSCQDDWAFSATGAAEGYNAVTTGRLFSLSEQQLLDCTPPASSCADSSPAGALTNLIANGGGEMATEADYPYTARIGACRQISPVTTVSGLEWTSSDETGLAQQITYHPVSVVFNGNWLSSYKSGIADPASCGTEPPQYVAGLVVGEVNGDVPHWIVKLSMGTTFGIQGYVELVKGKNACGIGNYALSVH